MTVAAPTPTSSVRAIIEVRRARSSERTRVSTAVMGPSPQPWGEPTAPPMAVRTVEAGLVQRGLAPRDFGRSPCPDGGERGKSFGGGEGNRTPVPRARFGSISGRIRRFDLGANARTG